MRHNNSNTTGSASNATCIYVSKYLTIILGYAYVTANTSVNTNNCSLIVTGGTIVDDVFNAWVGGETSSYLMYAGGSGDFYIHSVSTGSKTFNIRILGVIALSS